MQFDPPNVEIIRRLKDDRKSTKDIYVSRDPVCRRIDKSAKGGILEVPGFVGADTPLNPIPMIIGVNIQTADPKNKNGKTGNTRGVNTEGGRRRQTEIYPTG